MNSLTMPATHWRSDAPVIGLVGLAHCISHFSQLLLPPLFPWLKDAFQVSYAELGFLLTIFFVVSCVVQTLSGFLVDRYGPRPILFAGLGLLGLAAVGYAGSQSYWMLAACSVVAGVGNGVFHPVDYTLINRRVAKQRLGHAYSVHGITGSLGWALAPALLVPLTLAYSRIVVAIAVATVLHSADCDAAEPAGTPRAVEVCDARFGAGAIVRVRGVARVKGDGVLMSDLTCPSSDGGSANVPMRIRVVVKSFLRADDRERFSEIQDSFSSPIVQVVVRGKLSCRYPIRLVSQPPDGPTRGTGYGPTGLVACMIEDAVLERLAIL